MFTSTTTLLATLLALVKMEELEEYDQVCLDYSRDCERRADLCFTKVELMHRSCPKTCNVCQAPQQHQYHTQSFPVIVAAASPPKEPNLTTKNRVSTSPKSRRPSRTKCRDIASDCDETADLCEHASFKKMMKKQCAKTCGFCSSSGRSSSRSGLSGGGSDGDVLTISGLAGITEESEGRKSSSKKSAKGKEVDGLSISELVKLIRKAEETAENTTNCADMAYDCPIKQGLCGNARYSKLMLKMCMRTCNLCGTATVAP